MGKGGGMEGRLAATAIESSGGGRRWRGCVVKGRLGDYNGGSGPARRRGARRGEERRTGEMGGREEARGRCEIVVGAKRCVRGWQDAEPGEY